MSAKCNWHSDFEVSQELSQGSSDSKLSGIDGIIGFIIKFKEF